MSPLNRLVDALVQAKVIGRDDKTGRPRYPIRPRVHAGSGKTQGLPVAGV
jgi:hypothetical protein